VKEAWPMALARNTYFIEPHVITYSLGGFLSIHYLVLTNLK